MMQQMEDLFLETTTRPVRVDDESPRLPHTWTYDAVYDAPGFNCADDCTCGSEACLTDACPAIQARKDWKKAVKVGKRRRGAIPNPADYPCPNCGAKHHVPGRHPLTKKAEHFCAACGRLLTRFLLYHMDDGFLLVSAVGARAWRFVFTPYGVDQWTYGAPGSTTYRRQHGTLSWYAKAFCSIVATITAAWQPPQNVELVGTARKEIAVSKAVRNAVRRALYKKFRAAWERHAVVFAPEAIALHKRCWAVLHDIPKVTLSPELYQVPYIVEDAMKYRAAVHAIGNVERYHGHGNLAPLAHWRSDFVHPQERPNRAMNITLNNLPGGIPSQIVYMLASLRHPLTRPLTDRLEFLVYLNGVLDYRHRHIHVFQAATHKQIEKAFALYKAHIQASMRDMGNTSIPSLRKLGSIAAFVQYLVDYDLPFDGTSIVKLTEASIRWHNLMRRARNARMSMQSHGIAPEQPTIPPPIPPPAVDPETHPDVTAVRFLATAGELQDEGTALNHCVGSYAPQATGRYYPNLSFLFGITMADGARATAEVDALGELIQVRGPYNGQGEATRRLEEILRDWLRGWPRGLGWHVEIGERLRAEREEKRKELLADCGEDDDLREALRMRFAADDATMQENIDYYYEQHRARNARQQYAQATFEVREDLD